MTRFLLTLTLLIVTTLLIRIPAESNPISVSFNDSSQAESSEGLLHGPPIQDGPVVVQAYIKLDEIDEINDDDETFEFAAITVLEWHDPRQAFDPAVAGVNEKIFEGYYEYEEIFTGWNPQFVLINESGMYEKNGVILKVQADGTSTLIEKLNATAEMKLDMRKFPFDNQHLEAVFQVLGYDKDEVLIKVKSVETNVLQNRFQLPQWNIVDVNTSVRELSEVYGKGESVSSALVLSIDVERKSFYVVRLVIIPLIVIVLLSFSVFWMDRSSLGDRLNVSFIGILTGVAYYLVTSDQLPRISYFTLIHAFLNLSFLIMVATVVINLVVGGLDKKGKIELGDRVDSSCRWVFPLVYFGLLLLMFAVANIIY